MMRPNRKGFTIVELLMVIGVLGILVTIITTAASTAVRQSRARRTAAMMAVLQAGLETYYTQKGEWPGKLQSWADKGNSGNTKISVDYLDDKDADTVFQELVRESVKVGKSPLLDVAGLFVANSSNVKDDRSEKPSYGMDFMKAIINGKHHKKLKLANMAFGYTEKKTGWFRRFVIRYNFKTDSVTVMTQHEGTDVANDYYTENNIRWPEKPNRE